ncbi:MAG: putative DNA-binding domain-containing protein [Methylococcales bacterium]|nr:putative DNA-binding domain-containing protein [Methylococcales bacterium]
MTQSTLQTPSLDDYQSAFTAYLRNPEQNQPKADFLPERVDVYARLIINKISGNLKRCFPLTREFLGLDGWRALVRRFIDQHRCETPLYREIPDEFMAFLLDGGAPELPAFVIDMAHYEWVELALETASPESIPAPDAYNAKLIEQRPILNPTLALLSYRYPVQMFSRTHPDWPDWLAGIREPAAEPTLLAGVRGHDEQLHFVALNAMTQRLLAILTQSELTVIQALTQLAQELQYDSVEPLRGHAESLLENFLAQHIILGAQS